MRVIVNLLFPKTPTIARGEAKGNSWCQGGTINLLLLKYLVNKCFIIQKCIIGYYIVERQKTCLPCVVVCGFRDFSLEFRNFNVHYCVSSNESRGLKIVRKYIVYSVNRSLHNLPVNNSY